MSDPRPVRFRAARPDPQVRLAEAAAAPHPVALLCDGLDDPRNLGVLFRLAEAARLAHVYLYRLPPHLRSTDGGLIKKIGKISREAVRHVPWTILDDWDAVAALKERYTPVALEWTDQSVVYTEWALPEKTLLILGSETHGVSQELLNWSAAQIHLPMYGLNTSMNVAGATSIAVYELLRKLYAR